MAQIRLQKILSQAGVASRRHAEEMILAGRVAVDGVVVTELGSKADPTCQSITVDAKPLPRRPRQEYWMVNKPEGVVSTRQDPQGRRRVMDLLPPQAAAGLFPVGRLDYDSEGLILITNDGELAQRLTHPRYQVPKLYRVWVSGKPSAEAIEKLRTGVELEDGPTAPARVHLKASDGRNSKLAISLTEGRKREIRRMCEAVGIPVRRLLRVGMGSLRLGELPAGAARRLTVAEVETLQRDTGLISGCNTTDDGVKNPLAQRPGGESRPGNKGGDQKPRRGGRKRDSSGR